MASTKKAVGLNADGIRLADLEGLDAAPQESAYYTLGKTYKDTASLVTEEGEVVECNNEEDDDPEDEINLPGTTTLKWSTSDLDPESCHKAFGGELSDDKNEWTPPEQFKAREEAIQYTTRTGLKVTIGRAKVATRMNWEIKKNGYGLLEHTAKLLTPKIAGMKKMKISRVTE